jgi:hypothetical protein
MGFGMILWHIHMVCLDWTQPPFTHPPCSLSQPLAITILHSGQLVFSFHMRENMWFLSFCQIDCKDKSMRFHVHISEVQGSFSHAPHCSLLPTPIITRRPPRHLRWAPSAGHSLWLILHISVVLVLWLRHSYAHNPLTSHGLLSKINALPGAQPEGLLPTSQTLPWTLFLVLTTPAS